VNEGWWALERRVRFAGEGVTNAFPFAAFCSGNQSNARVFHDQSALFPVLVLQFSLVYLELRQEV